MTASSPPITIRLIYREEHSEALSLIHNSIRIINAKDYSPSQIQKIVAMYNSTLFKDGTVIVALQNSKMVGVAKIDNGFWGSRCIQAVFTHPDFVRRGVGSALMHELERKAIRQKTKSISIFASLTGVDFYKSLGYQHHGQNSMRQDLPIALMDKQLRPYTLVEQIMSTGIVAASLMFVCFVVVSISLIII